MYESLFLIISSSLCLCLLVIKPVYDYVRDPKGLRRFPGMTPLAPFTNIPYMWATVRNKRFKVVHEAHKKHTIVRVGPNSISFNDAAAVKDIHGHGTVALKDDFYTLLAGTHRHLADVKDRNEHSRKRRLLAAAYSQATIVHWEHIVWDRTRVLVEQYDRRCVESNQISPSLEKDYVNHRQWMNLFSIDAINEIGLSAGLRLLEAGDDIVEVQTLDGKAYKCHYRAALWNAHRILSRIAWASEWFPTLTKIAAWHPLWKYKVQFDDICIWQCRRRLARHVAGEKLDDFFSFLLHDKYGNPNMLPMGELIAECSIMMNAGSDTTAVALTNVLYHLIKNPICLEKLRDEVDNALDEDEVVAPYDKVKDLPFLRACLDESLRLTPPNTMNVPRITPPKGMTIMGEWIPGNTTVHNPPYSMHRNEKIFPEPDSFRPERWLREDSKDLQPHFITFSAGPRSCIGRHITYFEQTVVLATLLHRYTFQLPSPHWVLPQREAFTCSPGDMPILVRRREKH
jgi:hypothetical protein